MDHMQVVILSSMVSFDDIWQSHKLMHVLSIRVNQVTRYKNTTNNKIN